MKRSCQTLVGLKPPPFATSCCLSTVCFVLALLTAPPASAQDLSFLTNGLVAYYPLNGDVRDHSGYGNDGALTGALAVPDRFSVANGAVAFEGLGGHAQIPHSAQLAAREMENEITISAWMLRPSSQSGGWYVCKYNPADDGKWEIDINLGDGGGCFRTDASPWPNLREYCSSDLVQTDCWTHLVVTGSRREQRVCVYTNGSQAICVQEPDFRLGQSTGPLYLGYSPLGPDEFGGGQYDDLRLYSRALSETDVRLLHEYESTNLPDSPPIIETQPAGRAVGVGEDLTLKVRAYGSWPLSFQWRKGLTELSGAIQSTLHLTGVTLDDTGDYSVVVSNEFGTVTSDTVRVTVVIRPTRLFVSAESPNPTAPFANWTTAAREIQEAVDIAALGAEILVGDGIYSTGGRAVEGTVTNRVAVDRAVHLRSVNGPELTLIKGAPAPGGGTEEGAVRCVYLAEGASLTGFTLTNGFAHGDGGGAWCASTNAFLTNCVLAANVGSRGGGAYRGTLYQCTLMGNSAGWGGGARGSTLYDCVVSGNVASGWEKGSGGGGAESCTLYNCTVAGNSARWGGGASGSTLYDCVVSGNVATFGWERGGGGVASSTLHNCTVIGNSAHRGGGTSGSTLYNCTVTGNSAPNGGGTHSSTLHNCTVTGNTAVFSLGASSDSGMGGGVQGGAVHNSIVYGNYAYQGANWNGATFEHSCTTPLPTNGVGNIDVDPQLTWDGHLLPTSPCIGAGNAAYTSGVDLDGEAWAEVPSMGADEAAPDAARLRIHCSLEAVGVDYEQGFLAANADPGWAAVWDFDDGTRVTNQWLVSHAWQAPGTYTVRLTAFGAELPDGVATTASITVVPDRLHYVNAANPTPAPPYISWETAATSIQDAIETSTNPGRTILVTNGVYTAGGAATVAMGLLGDQLEESNRVVLPDYVTLRSVNGPAVTTIDGGGTHRCVHLARTALISGFTLTGGKAHGGGGAYGGAVVNCLVTGNAVVTDGRGNLGVGGGTYLSIVRNCRFTGNSAASWGGGAYHSTLHNSVLSDNSGSEGGASESRLYNCTVAWNGQSPYNSFHNCIVLDGHDDSRFEYSCASPLPEGPGNIEADPEFVDLGSGDFHLRPGSPCIGTGNAAHATGTDLDGEPWANPPSMGADEAAPDATRLRIQHALEEVGVDYAQKFAVLHAEPSWDFLWDFGDGTYVTNQYLADHAWQEPGNYTVRLTAYDPAFPQGSSVTSHVRVVPDRLHFVNLANPTPAAPYTSWETAATSIQDAVDATVGPGRTILVTNGVYQTGEVVLQGTNRVILPDYVTLRSVNGSDVTIIDGGGTNRCVHLARTASISGFTLSGGKADRGGGALGGVLRNCVLRANSGSGAADATLHDCLLEHNDGVGAAGSTLYDCVLSENSGRGADGSTLHRCTLTQNRGGGASGGKLYNCILTGNSGVEHGGGAAGSTLHNCTVTDNSATKAGGGVYEGRMVNSIVQLNQAPIRANWTHGDAGSISFAYSCTSPLPTSGVGNISADPLFVDAANGDFRLRPGSPCIDAGDPLSRLTTDILAVPRPLDGDGDGIARVDMGVYELNPYHFEAAMAVNTQGMQFTVHGEPGKTVRIDRSSDLLVWEPVATVPLPASGQTLIDPAAVGEQQLFYRLVKP
jgi:PKD repeat protein